MMFLVVSFVILAFVTYVLLCGTSERHSNDFIGQSYDFITALPSTVLRGLFKAVAGKKGAKLYDRFEKYVLTARNPFMAIFYNLMLSGGYMIFLWRLQPHVPNSYIPAYHTFTIPLACGLAFNLFLATAKSNPGIVTPNNVDACLNAYPFDNVLYTSRMCETCKIIKPARSKHCRYMGACVARFDHYCPWFFTAIGANNLRWFLLFLLYHVFLSAYGSYVVLGTLYGMALDQKLFDITFVSVATGEHIRGEWMTVFKYLMFEEMYAMFLGIALGIFCPVLIIFWGYHMYLVGRGTTTNETYKWSDIKESLINKADYQRVPNLYHRGFWKNIMEVMFPPVSFSSSSPRAPVAVIAATKSSSQVDVQSTSQQGSSSRKVRQHLSAKKTKVT